MQEILEKYKKYNIEYLRELGIVVINSKIPVQEFIYLKKDLMETPVWISELRVYGEPIYKRKRRF